MYPLTVPLQLEVIDGSMLKTGNITHCTFSTFKYHEYSFQFNFYILNHSNSDVVLGLDWLQKFNPKINWKKLALKLKDSKEKPHYAN